MEEALCHKHKFTPPAFIYAILWSLVDDKREMQTAYILIRSILIMVPGCAVVFWARMHVVGFAYVCVVVHSVGRDSLPANHYYRHNRKTFKSAIVTKFVNVMVSVLHGMPIGSYRVQHLMMHHRYTNHATMDANSTMPFQRDNVWHFLWHAITTWVLSLWITLPYHLYKVGRYMHALETVAWMWSHLLAVYWLHTLNPVAAVWTCIVPSLLTLLSGALHNWGQHMLVNPDRTKCNQVLHNTFNVINTKDNMSIFNDGYHAVHHGHAGVHWMDYPQHFRDNIETYKKEGCFYMHGLNNVAIAILCLRKRFDLLAKHVVRFDTEPCDTETFLRSRLMQFK